MARSKALLLLAAALLPLQPQAMARPVKAAKSAATAPAPLVDGTGRPAPRLLVAIAVDQFSADLFAQYRGHFTGGLARLAGGMAFPAGYQSHAATETCPGHSTILTGMRPAHTGIIANTWIDQSVGREKKTVYCAEDEAKQAADPKDYVASVDHLLVPTLGERMKQQWPASRNVAVSGKDRGALMMGGHAIDQVYWWKGKGTAPDMLSVSLSATDYIGHATGTEGAEMCIQMQQLDLALGDFFKALDDRGLDYAVVLTADHGGFDLPERLHEQALPDAERAAAALLPDQLSAVVGARLGLDPKGLVLGDGTFGDFWVKRDLPAQDKAKVLAEAKSVLLAQPQVQVVFTAAELAAAPMPSGSPETWSLLDRARASFYAPRSGDFVVILKRGVSPIVRPMPGIVATHGSAWDYDRRVPILFWRAGMTPFEQPSAVETVDIAPTLAALIALKAPAGTFDGRCLDLDAGPGSTCGATH